MVSCGWRSWRPLPKRKAEKSRWFHSETSGLICGVFSWKWAKTSCLSTAPRKCANAGAWSFCASFQVAPQGRGNGTFLIFAMQKHGKNNGHTIQRDCVTVFISIVLPTLFASTSYWRCSRMAACVVATKSRNKQASSIAILRLQSKLFNGQSVNKTGGMIYSSPWYLGSFLWIAVFFLLMCP